MDARIAELRKNVFAGDSLKRALDSWQKVDHDKDALARLRILLVGYIGHGKSAFVNTVERAVFESDKTVAALQDPSEEGTFFVDEFFHDGSAFSLIDTRGQYKDFDQEEIGEIDAMLSGRLRPGEILLRHATVPGDVDDYTLFGDQAVEITVLPPSEDMAVYEKVHAVAFVFHLKTAKLHTGSDLEQRLAGLRRTIQKEGYKPLCLLTHLDRFVEGSEKLREAKATAAANMQRILGCQEEDVYYIQNYTAKGECTLPATDETALRFILGAMGCAADFIVAQCTQQLSAWHAILNKQKKRPGDFVQQLKKGEVDLPIHVVLYELQRRHGWQKENVSKLLDSLLSYNLTSTRLVRKYWLKPPMDAAAIPHNFQQPLEWFLGISV